ncbi:MAG: hypothetical protein E7615_02130 [Ruminococcaceae bacterium]|nr:hypothetical protein [Oscillospiraceae bacterium]
MDKEASIKLSGYIAQKIIEGAPTVKYTKKDLEMEIKKYPQSQLDELQKEGYYNGNFETFFVVKKFCDMLDIWEYADDEYLKKLFANAKCHSKQSFYSDPYLTDIKVPTVSDGKFLLLNACYEKGELFQYDMPKLSEDIVVPKLGFFNDRVYFPSVYEGEMPWVSVCPSELNSMLPDVDKAEGRCLVLGLGLGYYPYMISRLDKVKSITVVEISEKIINLFEKYILPQFKNKDKIKLVHADAIDFMKNVQRDEYDFCYADIWEGQVDGAPLYQRIKEHERRLPYTRFAYWIEDEIRWYIDRM